MMNKRFIAAVLMAVLAIGMVSAAITREQAEEIALKDAGISSVDFIRIERDRDDGRDRFDVEFFADGNEYDYEIDAETGAIISLDRDAEHHWGNTSHGTAITDKDAGRIALEAAGVRAEDTERFRVREERDDGRAIYEVEFAAGGQKYEYNISVSDGRILGYSIERAASNPGPADGMTIEEAAAMALDRVKGAGPDDIRIHADRDDGRSVYEGTIWFDGYEYEFEIDAASGRFTEWDRDREDGWF